MVSGRNKVCPYDNRYYSNSKIKLTHNNDNSGFEIIVVIFFVVAVPMSPIKNLDLEFAYGSEHIDPLKAIDPGLVYDAGESDFVSFLCGQGYNATTLKIVTGDASTCSTTNNETVWDLNYPSFALSVQQPGSIVQTFNRTVTNVGASNSSYQANVVSPKGLVVKVDPSSLEFKAVGEKQSFVVTVDAIVGSKTLSGSLVWSDGVHHVTSPIVAFVV